MVIGDVEKEREYEAKCKKQSQEKWKIGRSSRIIPELDGDGLSITLFPDNYVYCIYQYILYLMCNEEM